MTQLPKPIFVGIHSNIFKGPCFWCGRPTFKRGPRKSFSFPDTYTRDHLIPKKNGGKGFTVTACYDCNHRKASKHPKEFLQEINNRLTKKQRDQITNTIGRCISEIQKNPKSS